MIKSPKIKVLFWLAVFIIWLIFGGNLLFAQTVERLNKITNFTHFNAVDKQLEIGGNIYNYRDKFDKWNKGNSEIATWADATPDGNTMISALSNLITEFPDSSTGEIVIRKRDGSKIYQRFIGIAYLDKPTLDYELIQQTPTANTDILGGDNSILYENIYPGVDLRYEKLEDRLKEELIVSQDRRASLNSPYPDSRTWIVLVTEIRTDMDIVNDRDGSNPFVTASMQEDSLTYGFKINGNRSIGMPLKWAYLSTNDSTRYPMKTFTRKINGRNFMLSGMRYNLVADTVNYKGDLILDPTWVDGDGGDVDTDKDNFMAKSGSTQNFGALDHVQIRPPHAGGGEGETNRALFEFDVSGVSGNVITALLHLVKQGTSGFTTKLMATETITTAWDEGTGTGANGASSWDSSAVGVEWTLAGGDFTTPKDTATVTAADADIDFDIASLVQGWVDGGSNLGLMMKWDDETEVANPGLTQNWFSSDNGTSSNRPKLTVTFELIVIIPDIITRSRGTILHEARGFELNAVRAKGKIISKVKKKGGD